MEWSNHERNSLEEKITCLYSLKISLENKYICHIFVKRGDFLTFMIRTLV